MSWFLQSALYSLVVLQVVYGASISPQELEDVLQSQGRDEVVAVVFYHANLPLWNKGGANETFHTLVESMTEVTWAMVNVEEEQGHVGRHALRSLPVVRVYPPNLGAAYPVDVPFAADKTVAQYQADLNRLLILSTDSVGDLKPFREELVPLLTLLDPAKLKEHEVLFETEGRKEVWTQTLETLASNTPDQASVDVDGSQDNSKEVLVSEDDLDLDYVPVDVRKHMLLAKLDRTEANMRFLQRTLELRVRRVEFLLQMLRLVRERGTAELVGELESRTQALFKSGTLGGEQNIQVRENLLLEASTLSSILSDVFHTAG